MPTRTLLSRPTCTLLLLTTLGAASILTPAPAPAADVDWMQIQEAVAGLPEQIDRGGEAVLDKLEGRAREVLARLEHPTDPDVVAARVPELRKRLAESVGYRRLPQPRPRDVRRVGIVDRGDYVIEKLVYETLPDLLVPAHLYRPAKTRRGDHPAVLFVPGHWWVDSKSRPSFQAFCINMARWGFFVLTYDPIGQGERGVSFRDHRRTPSLLVGISQQAVMVHESKCALEYLLSRDEIDPERIGITGASGGGYNSWTMTALDDRIAASVPVVGTSDFFEQLHVCRPLDWYQAKEHCHFVAGLLRYADNHELIAMAAPRPLLVISAQNDQSFPIPGIRRVVGHGRRLYSAHSVSERFAYFEDAAEGHGYQQAKREAAYGWFLCWLARQGDGGPVPEPDTDTLPYDSARLRCFPPGENRPAGPALTAHLKRLIDDMPQGYRPPLPRTIRTRLLDAVGLDAPAGEVELHRAAEGNVGGVRLETVRYESFDGLPVPGVLLAPTAKWQGAVVAAADLGRASLLENPGVRAALEANLVVLLADVRGTGELAIDKPGWTFAVNLLLGENFVGRQAHDLAAAVRGLKQLPELDGKPVAVHGVGPFCSLAAQYAAVMEPDVAWLVAEGGFVSYRSFIDRPESLRHSFALSAARPRTVGALDLEIPHALFVFDVLGKFDIPDLMGSIAPRPALVARPIDGDWHTLDRAAAERLVRSGRYRWKYPARIATGPDYAEQVRAFIHDQLVLTDGLP